MIITTMLTSQQLRQAADLKEKIEALQSELDQVMGAQVVAPAIPDSSDAGNNGKPKKRNVRSKGRASGRAAQKQVSEAKLKALAKARAARWAKFRAAKNK
jgi:hypothetical protein